MELQARIQAPLPRFFKKVRLAGLILTAISATVLTAPVALPAAVVTAAGYLAVAGSVATVVSQTATGGRRKKKAPQPLPTKKRRSGR